MCDEAIVQKNDVEGPTNHRLCDGQHNNTIWIIEDPIEELTNPSTLRYMSILTWLVLAPMTAAACHHIVPGNIHFYRATEVLYV